MTNRFVSVSSDFSVDSFNPPKCEKKIFFDHEVKPDKGITDQPQVAVLQISTPPPDFEQLRFSQKIQ